MPKAFLTLNEREFTEAELDREFEQNGHSRTAIIYQMLKEILKAQRAPK